MSALNWLDVVSAQVHCLYWPFSAEVVTQDIEAAVGQEVVRDDQALNLCGVLQVVQ